MHKPGPAGGFSLEGRVILGRLQSQDVYRVAGYKYGRWGRHAPLVSMVYSPTQFLTLAAALLGFNNYFGTEQTSGVIANMSPAPLVKHIYVADPSAHSFDGRIYVYPSHDRETDIKFNDKGDQYDMVDYHVISMDRVGAEVTDHGVALKAEDVPWVSKQLWAPDAAKGADGKYYLYFPARDKEGESVWIQEDKGAWTDTL